MNNKIFRFGPIALTTTLTANLLNPPTATGGTNGGTSPQQIVLRHVRVLNKTASAATFSLWLGTSGSNSAGTEFIGTALSVAANSAYDWYGSVVINSADFLVGGSGTSTALTIQGEGEIGVA